MVYFARVNKNPGVPSCFFLAMILPLWSNAFISNKKKGIHKNSTPFIKNAYY
jgi:hypothetical protein